MLQLNKLKKLHRKRKRIGRGGDRGGTSGRGHKGQRARSGGRVKATFEGGQMSLTRRLPKRGFTNNAFKKDVRIINLKTLELKFEDGQTVDKKSLREKGLLKGVGKFKVKILGNGKLTKKLIVCADLFSKRAAVEIQQIGGQVRRGEEM